MNYYIDLLSLQTPKHLRSGYENQTRFDFGHFEVNIFETFQSSTKVQIQYDGLSISSMIRGKKIVYNKNDDRFDFLPGTSLILMEGETIYADFPEAEPNNPVQCATLLIPQPTIVTILDFLNSTYPKPEKRWELDFENFHFNNNSALVRAINELLQLTHQKANSTAIVDLMLKSVLTRVIEAQQEDIAEKQILGMNNQLLRVKNFIKEHLSKTITSEDLMRAASCSRSSLYRMFEAYCNKTPGGYILHERLNLAKNLLLNPDHNVSDVAFLSGFSSVSYFSQQFKQANKLTPGDYIKRFRG